MSIRKKSFILSLAFLIGFVLILLVFVEINIWQEFNYLENQAVIRALERSGVGINDRIKRLQTSSQDWAEWTDAYNYVLGNYPEFIENNISENQFISLGLNHIFILNNKKEIIFNQNFDLDNKSFFNPSDEFLSKIFNSIKSENELVGGVIHGDGIEPTFIAARPILKTDGSGPSVGMLIFGRKIDSEIINNISQITSFDFSFFSESEINNLAYSEVAVKKIIDSDNYIDKSNSDIAYGYTHLINDLDGNRDLILRVSLPREIYKSGLSVSLQLAIGLLSVSLLGSLAFIYLINLLVIKRISFLVERISDLENGKSKIEELELAGDDEISFLSKKLKSAISEAFEVKEKASLRNKELEQSQKAILNVLEDIEVEKNKSESLVQDLQKFKLAVDNASDHIIITDHNGKILYANKAVETITGFSLKEVIGNNPSLWGKQMPREFYENLWKTIKEEKVTFIGELKNKRKNGEIYIAEASISPILNNNGSVIFFVGIERDITKLKEISDAKTEFVSVASHQLRTPLTGIKWLTEVMLKNKENNLNEKQKETLKEINTSNDRVINLVNDLLSISRIEGGESKTLTLKDIEMTSLLNEVIRGLVPVAENRKVVFESVIAIPKDLVMKIDEEKIRQSMNNLISNGIKYSKVGGGRVDVLAEIKDNEFIFSVKDNGIGIPLKDQRRLFEKFFRADNAVLSETEGTGLGLPIVKAYVEAHGGRVWFESEENNGSNFHFSLKIN